MSTRAPLRIAVIGAGPAGIGAGYQLRQQGFEDFTIFEKAPAAGGTWHLHTYPGLACDVWAHSYTFSWRPNPDWTANFVEQPEIEAYLQECVREFGLQPKLELNTRITKATWDESRHWVLESRDGRSWEFDVVINAMGNQHTPLWPDVPGRDSFAGDFWHATRWNHDVPLAGKKVVVVGSAASAVQIVPELAKVAGHLTVLQRTPNWIMPRGRVEYSERRRGWFRRFPPFLRATRRVQHLLMSFVHQAATIGHKRMGDFEKRAKKYIASVIEDPALREAVTPKSQYACKRGLVSDDFYPALLRENVELVADGLAEVRPAGIVTSGGREIDADVIVYCTGYRILDFDRIDVHGRDGLSLADAMAAAPEAHKGIAAPGFPNWFFAVGPNGLVLSVPYFKTVERNLASIVGLLAEKQGRGVRSLEVKRSAHQAYNEWMGTQFPLYSWASPSCNSYYQTAEGRAPFLFPGTFQQYEDFHEELSLEEFETEAA